MGHALVRMSERLWGLRWEEHLPWDLGHGVELRAGTLGEALSFISEHYSAIFRTGEQGTRALGEEMTPAKHRFLQEADVFVARHGPRVVGIFLSHPTDWSSYYHRTGALLPEYQGLRVTDQFLARVERALRGVGCVRVEAETAASNTAMLRLMARRGYSVVSTSLSERFGATVRFCRFLTDEAQEAFVDQFCCGVQYARRGGVSPESGGERSTA